MSTYNVLVVPTITVKESSFWYYHFLDEQAET